MIAAPRAVRVVRTRDALRDSLVRLRHDGQPIVLVPTMGALHAGHLLLLDRARASAAQTVVSIFVNPLQFGPGEDLDRYPRDLDRDLLQMADRGVRLVFAPDEGTVYPEGVPRVLVDPGTMGDRLCGAHRPGHFRGVLTVVLKLFSLIQPDIAVFGRKDLQQLALIRRMVRDLDLPVRIEQAPIVRDADGLALSSRNAYLSTQGREQALGLYRALVEADRRFRAGETSARALLDTVRSVASRHSGLRLQYAEVVDSETLDALEDVPAGAALAVAGHVSGTRLIDNLVLGAEDSDPRDPEGRLPAPGS